MEMFILILNIFVVYLACQKNKEPYFDEYKKEKNVSTAAKCKQMCKNDTDCDFFKWKVILSS